jgi:peptide/nickel transport system permease protein
VKYLGRRLLHLVLVLVAVTLLTFFALRALGDAAELTAGPGATPEQIQATSERLGLDDPLPVQYVRWVGDLLTGDLGISFAFNTPTATLIRERLPVSLVLMLYAQILALVTAIPLAVWAAYRHDRWFDRLSNTGAFVLLSTPSLVLAVLLSLVFAARLGWFPAIGKDVGLFEDPVEHIKVYTLPTITLAAGLFAGYFRLLRADMLATLQQDFMVLARAKGMPTRFLLFRHALRPSSFSLVTAAAVNIGALVGGAFIVEYLFSQPGMALLTVEAINRQDYAVVQVAVVVFAVIFVLANFAVDLLYGALDPRVRHVRALA